MDRQALLEQAIRTLARRAGIAQPAFHILCVSQDAEGIFIMQSMWPESRLLCEGIARAVAAFPSDHYTTCIALLPDLVDDIICAARKGDAAVDAPRATAVAGRH